VRAPAVEERKIAAKLGARLGNRLIGMQVDVLIFHAFPESFDKHVIDPTALPSTLILMLLSFSICVKSLQVH
ncbi:MAG: hypothetical protein ABI476_03190, partial [Oxalobacteraceae bacterium]